MGRKEGAQGGTPGGHVCAASQADNRRTRLRRFERVRSAALTLAPPPPYTYGQRAGIFARVRGQGGWEAFPRSDVHTSRSGMVLLRWRLASDL